VEFAGIEATSANAPTQPQLYTRRPILPVAIDRPFFSSLGLRRRWFKSWPNELLFLNVNAKALDHDK
jgi:hypothetical protein